ncbi:MAG: LemA family protein [Patescibacteria group bacterium]
MQTTTLVILVFLAVVLVIAGLAVLSYNSLISLKNKVKEGKSDIDVQLKRRYDLIPNLVETVKGAANFESSTLEKVIQARNQAVAISGISKEKAEAENALSGALRQLFALSENYPQLRANENYMQLQEELVNTEDRILASRRFYNQVVSDYNTTQDQFPTLLFKGLAGAKPEPFFEIENPAERENVKVQF